MRWMLIVAALAASAHAAGEEGAGPWPKRIAGLDAVLAPKGTLLLGEFHGTWQAPRFVAELICTVSTAASTSIQSSAEENAQL